MPPFLPRKRLKTSPPPLPPPPASKSTSTRRAQLTDALDAEATNNGHDLKTSKSFDLGSDSDSDSDSSLSDIDSDQFEEVTAQSKEPSVSGPSGTADSGESEGGEDDIEWEDAAVPGHQGVAREVPGSDGGGFKLNIRTADDDGFVVDYNLGSSKSKKGPNRREKEARIRTHQMHVQFLLFHNAIRNSWTKDEEVQRTLIKQLPLQIVKEVTRWRRASGLKKLDGKAEDNPPKGKRKRTNQSKNAERGQRDWSQPSQRLEEGKPDLSHGDPLIVLMKVLAAYWKKRFAITAPGLRKRGYSSKLALKQEISSFRNDKHSPARHGERIRDLKEFRALAIKCEGSRDVGAQLFTALLRGLGIEARMVASLQPSGYGWTKFENMVPKKPVATSTQTSSGSCADLYGDSESESGSVTPSAVAKKSIKHSKSTARATTGSKPSTRSNLNVIELDSDGEVDTISVKDDDSVVDVTPSMPTQRRAKFDRDLRFPVYWTEVISPITHKVLAVSPLVLDQPVAATSEALSSFEPRGAKAESVRQVIAYVVAYASDGTAKDVTVRYLKKQIWPGKTKGVRIPPERVPVYDVTGRVKRHEDYDWFRHTLSLYERSPQNRSAADDLEDSTDLVPQQPENKKNDEGIDTLQSLKQSADFCLERFLRREEALKPGAKPVRHFVSGKGDNIKEEAVYHRADVERCLTAESWHKEGRRPGLGETPMKLVPVRAVTLTRKREAEEHERITGEKQMQGLYSWDQTEWIIPPPIENGIIPKNAYGNMDAFVPSMVPKGAVHIPLKGTVRICKKLEIDFAEAVTGFEFGNKRAVPVCTGVVVARENEQAVKDAWRIWNEEQRRKEETKLEKLVLDLWRKFVLGLRIRQRVTATYGDHEAVSDAPLGDTTDRPIEVDDDEANVEPGGGGFVAEAEDDLEGGFLIDDESDKDGDLILAEGVDITESDGDGTKDTRTDPKTGQYPTPASMPADAKMLGQHHTGLDASPMVSDDEEQNSLDNSSDAHSEDLFSQAHKRREAPSKTSATTSKRRPRQTKTGASTKVRGRDVAQDQDQVKTTSKAIRNSQSKRQSAQPTRKRDARSSAKHESAQEISPPTASASTNTSSGTNASTPKRSRRLQKREGSKITSPFFSTP